MEYELNTGGAVTTIAIVNMEATQWHWWDKNLQGGWFADGILRRHITLDHLHMNILLCDEINPLVAKGTRFMIPTGSPMLTDPS